jgi:general secretion pathway protein A
MYTAFYGLREKPFALSPDPRFLYLAGSHREALAHLLYGIEQGEGFISVTGEVGTGKTTLCRTLLERLDGDIELAFLFNPSRTALELLQSICAEFGLPAEGLARRSLMTQLNTFLLERKRAGRRVLLIVDEAQTLSENTLEQIRLLSNLETSREKLIQILLLGQPELDRKLDERGLRQLRQRISVRWKLEPLGPQETRAYVRHRLAVAAGEPKDLFTEAALREVHRRTGGIPRLVNQLCDRALLGGYAARAAQIGPSLIRAAAREIPDAHPGGHRPGGMDGAARASRGRVRPWMIFATSLSLVGVSLFAGLQVGRSGLTASMRASVFKSDALERNADGDPRLAGARNDGIPPSVGARGGASNTAGQFGPLDGPPLGELLGYLPSEIREGLRPTAAQLEEGTDSSRVVSSATSLPIPDRPATSREAALAPGLLPRLLANRNAQVALSESQTAMLRRFGRRVPAMAPAPSDPEELRRMIEGRGLRTTPFEGGSVELLRRLDHPVVVALVAVPRGGGGGERLPVNERWVAITGFRGDRARVAGLLADHVVTVKLDEIEDHWVGAGIVVWEGFEPIPEVLARNDDGQGVLWLQRGLAELGFFEGSPTSEFDAPTLSAVSRYQRDRGLVSDGVAGPLTQIALYADLGRYPVPRLSQPEIEDGLAPNSTAEEDSGVTSSTVRTQRDVRRTSLPAGERG